MPACCSQTEPFHRLDGVADDSGTLCIEFSQIQLYLNMPLVSHRPVTVCSADEILRDTRAGAEHSCNSCLGICITSFRQWQPVFTRGLIVSAIESL